MVTLHDTWSLNPRDHLEIRKNKSDAQQTLAIAAAIGRNFKASLEEMYFLVCDLFGNPYAIVGDLRIGGNLLLDVCKIVWNSAP